MEMNLFNKTRRPSLERYRKDFECLADRTWKRTGASPCSAFSVIQVNDDQIRRINAHYRKIDRPTDVITFALRDSDDPELAQIGEGQEELGDIFLNIDAAGRQAEKYRHSLRREICFLYLHGLLHLLGYDHMKKEEEQRMFSLQREILDSYIPFDDQDQLEG